MGKHAPKLSIAVARGSVAPLRPMVERGSVLTAIAVVVCGMVVSVAEAQPAKPATPTTPAKAPTAAPANPVPASKQPLQPIGASQVMKLTSESGFVDEVIAYDNQRVAYVIADTSTRAELHVVQLGCATCIEQKQEILVDLSPVTLRPIALRLVGQKAFVIG